MASSIYKIPITFPGALDAVNVTAGGANYSNNPTITFTSGGGTGASAIAVVSAGIITSILVTTTGQGYTGNPTVDISDPTGNGAMASAVVNVIFVTISGGNDILGTDITFTRGTFRPGESGLIRVWFCFQTDGDADTIITIAHDKEFTNIVQLNSDQNFVIKSTGLYRFDISARVGDEINIRSSEDITAIRLLRLDKIVIGA